MTLPAFAAERRCGAVAAERRCGAVAAERRAAAPLLLSAPATGTRSQRPQPLIDISCPQGAQQQTAPRRCCCRPMGQTDRRTDGHSTVS